MSNTPGFVALARSGELASRAARLLRSVEHCELCPRRCGARRLAGEVGVCGAGRHPKVARSCAHLGEEPPLSGTKGAGTIFFAGCGLGCVYCQNHQISQPPYQGTETDALQLAQVMMALQQRGCHNIALVTPGHALPTILAGLAEAAQLGLRLPIVYNTSAYERVSVLRELEGVVDVYLPDLKYGHPGAAAAFSHAPDYVERSQAAVIEMLRQVGPLQLDGRGLATRGLIVRHLVLPDGHSGSERVLGFIADRLGRRIHVSLMAQYRPPQALSLPRSLQRSVSAAEYEVITAVMAAEGLTEGWVQAPDSVESYVPDFERDGHPFE